VNSLISIAELYLTWTYNSQGGYYRNTLRFRTKILLNSQVILDFNFFRSFEIKSTAKL